MIGKNREQYENFIVGGLFQTLFDLIVIGVQKVLTAERWAGVFEIIVLCCRIFPDHLRQFGPRAAARGTTGRHEPAAERLN